MGCTCGASGAMDGHSTYCGLRDPGFDRPAPTFPREGDVLGLTNDERSLLISSALLYRSEVRKACLEDQGTEEGEPGTLGREIQERLAAVAAKLGARMM